MRRQLVTMLFTSCATLALVACGGGRDASDPVARIQAQALPAATAAAETGRGLDLAIDGDGQFLWRDSQDRLVYSREAGLGLDADGSLVNRSGARLLGLPSGQMEGGALQVLALSESIPPHVTTSISLECNLDSRLPITERGLTPGIDFANAATYNNASSMTVYDPKGQPVALAFYFQKAADDTWNVYLTVNGTTVGGSEDDPQPIVLLRFHADGTTPSPSSITLDVPAGTNAGGANTLPIPGIAVDLANATQYGSSFAMTLAQQDGYQLGWLTALTLGSGGALVASYNNGQTVSVGKVVLARFVGTEQFMPTAQGWLQVTGAAPFVTVPGLGLNGLLRTGYLETDAQLSPPTGL